MENIKDESTAPGQRPAPAGLRWAILSIMLLLSLLGLCLVQSLTMPEREMLSPHDVTMLSKKAGLELLPKEGVAEHIHAHLSVTFNGQPVEIPANIGIDTKRKLYSEIHTHDTSGILHVESSKPRPFYLRQAIIEWPETLTAHGINGYENGVNGARLITFVNQKPYPGDLRKLELANKQDISIAITTNGEVPKASSPFKWPANY